jgi:hypothetical protein
MWEWDVTERAIDHNSLTLLPTQNSQASIELQHEYTPQVVLWGHGPQHPTLA